MNTPFTVNRGGVIDLNLITLEKVPQTNGRDNPTFIGINRYSTPLWLAVDWWLDGYATKIGVAVTRDILAGNYTVDFYDHKPTEWMTDLWLVKAMDCGTIGGSTPNYDPCIGRWYRWNWVSRKWEEIVGRGVYQTRDAEYIDHLRSLNVFAQEPYPQQAWR